MCATPTPDPAAAVRAQAHAVKDALTPRHAGYDYDDFADIPAPASGAAARASYRRLQKIKAAYDPGQAIISPPSPSGRPGRDHTASGCPGNPHPSNNRPPPTRYRCRRPWLVNVRNSKPLGRTHEQRSPRSART